MPWRNVRLGELSAVQSTFGPAGGFECKNTLAVQRPCDSSRCSAVDCLRVHHGNNDRFAVGKCNGKCLFALERLQGDQLPSCFRFLDADQLRIRKGNTFHLGNVPGNSQLFKELGKKDLVSAVQVILRVHVIEVHRIAVGDAVHGEAFRCEGKGLGKSRIDLLHAAVREVQRAELQTEGMHAFVI